MPYAKSKNSRRPDPRGPLVFSIAALAAGSVSSVSRTVPAPAALEGGLVCIPAGAELQLEVQLEEVSDGVLVTAEVDAPISGECARCLSEFSAAAQVRFQELFSRQPGGTEDDGYLLDGNLLDLEPALRDALVLELPLSPLCTSECEGLCSECGIRLADAPPGHGHQETGSPWAVLKDFVPAGAADAGLRDSSTTQDMRAGTKNPGGSKER